MTHSSNEYHLPGPKQDRIDAVFTAQQATARRLRSSSRTERLMKLRQLRKQILQRQDDIRAACHADFRKPASEVDIAEITPILAEIKHVERHLWRWMRGRHVWPTMLLFGTRARIRYQPKGTALIIAPWNYPFNLSLMPLVSAIAAGCSVTLKPSELAPHSSRLIREIVEATFEEHDVAVFEGDADTARALLDKPFDHMFFTGSTAVGKQVMQAAAHHLSSVTLELGGKSPVIIDQSADLKKAATSLMWGKFANCGQTCTAPDYLYVHEDIRDEFIQACIEQLSHAYGVRPDRSADYGRIVNSGHFDRLKGLIDEALDRGARLLAGGESDPGERYIAPTLLLQPQADSAIMQEEIFGPVLPILTYRDVAQVIEAINARPQALALYIYSKNPRLTEDVLAQTSAGGYCINQCVVQYLHLNLPFGGVGDSGMGSTHGYWGFKAFSHERSVVENRFAFSHWLAPPYTDLVKRLIAISMASLK